MTNSDDEGDDDHRLRTIRGAARHLSVSPATIYRLGKTGELELIKIGRATRVTLTSIERYVKNAEKMVPRRK